MMIQSARRTVEEVLFLFMLAAVGAGAGCTERRTARAASDGSMMIDAGAVCCQATLDASASDSSSCCAPDAEAVVGDAGDSWSCEQTDHSLTVGVARPELAAENPAVKWVKKVAGAVAVGSRDIVMSRDSISVPIGNGLAILSKSSGVVKTFVRPGSEIFNSSIAASDGTFLIAARNAYAVDGDGQLVWSVPLGAGQPIADEWSQCRMLYSSRRQILIAVCNDGVMYGLSTADRGRILWEQQVYREGLFDVLPAPSAGGIARVEFPTRYQPAGTWAVEPSSGRRLGVVVASGDSVWATSSRGFLTRSSPTSGPGLLDECGRFGWRSSASGGVQIPMVLGVPGERILLLEQDQGGTRRLGVISSEDGQRVAGPTGGGSPIAAGADGTLFAVTCNNADPTGETTAVAPELVAYSGSLEEKWRVALSVPPVQGRYRCPRPGVALDEDGVMYLAVEADGTYLIAVQTRSPGVAATSWPLRFGGQNGSRWID